MSLSHLLVMYVSFTHSSLITILVDRWPVCLLLLVLASCLLFLLQKRVVHKGFQETHIQTSPSQDSYTRSFSFTDILSHNRHRRKPSLEVIAPASVSLPVPPTTRKMRYHPRTRRSRTKKNSTHINTKTRQPFEAFLILDIEGTCQLGGDFNYPNEIIEFPVSLLEWSDRADGGKASILDVVEEFRTFVKPTWRPTLSAFCTELTGITQDQVNSSPTFSEVLVHLEAFLVKNGLIEEGTGRRLKRFCWCSDGPFDIRDFVVKQCFISQVEMPSWMQGDVLDVRSAVLQHLTSQSSTPEKEALVTPVGGATRRSLNITAQLKALGLPEFEGRQHSGIDDTRNIAKIVTELAQRGMCLLPNTAIHPGRRWKWMGKYGHILEEELA